MAQMRVCLCLSFCVSVRGGGRSQEWVVQRYVRRPMLVDGRKFHLRVYVLAVGRLSVYVCRDMLVRAPHPINGVAPTAA
eukprot:COSAG01_NODE_1168_length_11426_cov_339.595038_8_plen_79_part_00